MLQVSGLFDAVTVQSIEDAITRSEDNGSQALILQLNTGGSVVSTADMRALLQRCADAKVAIGRVGRPVPRRPRRTVRRRSCSALPT